jgi:hypothetical protein
VAICRTSVEVVVLTSGSASSAAHCSLVIRPDSALVPKMLSASAVVSASCTSFAVVTAVGADTSIEPSAFCVSRAPSGRLRAKSTELGAPWSSTAAS